MRQRPHPVVPLEYTKVVFEGLIPIYNAAEIPMSPEPKGSASRSPGPAVTIFQVLICLFCIAAALVAVVNPPPDENGRAMGVAGVILFGLPGAVGLCLLFRRWRRGR